MDSKSAMTFIDNVIEWNSLTMHDGWRNDELTTTRIHFKFSDIKKEFEEFIHLIIAHRYKWGELYKSKKDKHFMFFTSSSLPSLEYSDAIFTRVVILDWWKKNNTKIN